MTKLKNKIETASKLRLFFYWVFRFKQLIYVCKSWGLKREKIALIVAS